MSWLFVLGAGDLRLACFLPVTFFGADFFTEFPEFTPGVFPEALLEDFAEALLVLFLEGLLMDFFLESVL